MQTTLFIQTQCAYVTQASPNTNFYDMTSIFTGRFSNSEDIYRLYAKFDFNKLDSQFKKAYQIKSAILNLELTRNEIPKEPGSANLYIYRLLSEFDESKITWNTQPTANKDIDSAISISSGEIKTLEIDITTLVREWLNGNIQNNGILIKGEEQLNSLVGFPNHNYIDKNITPKLIITFEESRVTALDEKLIFNKFYTSKSDQFKNYIEENEHIDTNKLAKIINNNKYKGIVVYPCAVHWEPLQRPQQILLELSKRGYLCFFCCPPSNEFYAEEISPNMFLLNHEHYLIPYLKNKFIIILCTWLIQLSWADQIPNKFIWYDILDRIDFFSCYDQDMLLTHNRLVDSADIMTYSSKPLAEYILKRTDAIYLPNAVKPEEFINTEKPDIPNQIKSIVEMKKPIIGYFGAIEEWFDCDMVLNISQNHPDWQFVFIGNVNSEAKENLRAKNIHLIGAVKHDMLARYAQHFDVCIIPFKINKLTNSVSPVKLFEYAALGKPIVSTPLEEIKQYQNNWLTLASNTIEFEEKIHECLQEDIKKEAMIKGIEFANKNTWSDRVDIIKQAFINSKKGLNIYSNIDNTGMACVMCATFLDFLGSNFYSGGAERYLCDLYGVFKNLGIRMLVYQYGLNSWVRRYNDIDIISLADSTINEKVLNYYEKFNENFYFKTQFTSLLNIYSAFFEAYKKNVQKSIGISHGIAWDSPSCVYSASIDFFENNKRYIQAAKDLDTIISVDTNTANWFQTVDYNIASKIKVVPNYVDTEKFTPRDDFEILKDRITILYPRRFYAARGFYIVLEVMDYILKSFSNVDFHFVGRGMPEDTIKLQQKIKQWPSRVKWYELSFEEMPSAYKDADITIIPTLFSEGTSMSCLEAMASGNAIIASRVGGLTDLVIDGFNGLLINPTANDLKISLITLLNDHEKIISFKKNAANLAKAFSKNNWENKWTDIIKSKTDTNKINANTSCKLIEIYLIDKNSLQNINLRNLIAKYLCENCLLYIRIKNANNQLSKSYGRLQFLRWDEPTLSNTDYVIMDKKSSKILKKLPDFLLTPEYLE